MTDGHDGDARSLRLVPEPDQAHDGAPTPDPAGPDEATADTAPEDGVDGVRDPLLARAEGIADLPLAERPAAFDGLNRALVAELNQLEEG